MSTWGRRIVGTLQIFGGGTVLRPSGFSALAMAWRLGLWPVLVAILLLSVLSMVAGILMLRNHPKGVRVSKLCQALQIPIVYTSIISYQYVMGISLNVGIGRALWGNWDWGYGFTFWLMEGDKFSVGLNLVAAALYFYLYFSSRRDKESGLAS